MYRVGILGTENSHAMAFAKTMNIPDKDGNYKYPDFRVTALYALEKTPSENIIAATNDSSIKIVDSPEEMLPLVDCVMVTARHGKYHKDFVMPFIKAGMPAFIDKPFTVSVEDAREILKEAAAHNVPLTGGSGCKFAPQLRELKEEIGSGNLGDIESGCINFPAELDSEYGGIFFYGSHLVEMTLMTFGYDIKSVQAFAKNGHLTAIARYDNYDIVMNFVRNGKYLAIAYGRKGNSVKTVDISDIYSDECGYFISMVRTGKPPMTPEMLAKPVFVLNAIDRSLKEHREVSLSEF